VYNEYVETLNSCTNKFPFAQLFVSSIAHRLPVNERATQLNEAVQDVNRLLRELPKSEPNVSLIDNDVILVNDKGVCHNLYSQTDKTGVHLNETGRNLMADVFVHALKDFFDNR
jgi:lysophospholipase L1-like esterase